MIPISLILILLELRFAENLLYLLYKRLFLHISKLHKFLASHLVQNIYCLKLMTFLFTAIIEKETILRIFAMTRQPLRIVQTVVHYIPGIK